MISVNSAQLSYNKIKRNIFNEEYLPYFILGVVFIVGSIISPYFLNFLNVTNVFRQAVAMTFLGIGEGVLLISGGVDLSIGAVVSMSQCVACGMMMGKPENMLMAIVVVYALALIIGLINGLIVTYRKAAPFIVTLGMASVIEGLNLVYTDGLFIGSVPPAFRKFANLEINLFPVPILYIVILLVVGIILLRKNKFGVYIYALGGNEESARLSGISTNKIKLFTYILCSVFAATAGLFLASRMGVGDPRVGDPFTLDCIACVVIGGVSLKGGKGRIGGIIAGVLAISFLTNLLNMMSVNSFVQLVIKGAIIIGAVAMYELRGEKVNE